jgi:hypothetical protein
MDGHRLRASEKRFLREISGSAKEEFTGGWKTCSVVNDMICNRINGYEKCEGACGTQCEKRKVYAISVAKFEVKRQLGRPWVHGRVILKWIIKKWNGRVCAGLI